jgi:hypothetical protein
LALSEKQERDLERRERYETRMAALRGLTPKQQASRAAKEAKLRKERQLAYEKGASQSASHKYVHGSRKHRDENRRRRSTREERRKALDASAATAQH